MGQKTVFVPTKINKKRCERWNFLYCQCSIWLVSMQRLCFHLMQNRCFII